MSSQPYLSRGATPPAASPTTTQSTRNRMYLFERAYVDYIVHVKRFTAALLAKVKAIWHWFWLGPGSRVFEVLLQIATVASGLVLGVLYLMYQREHGQSFSVGAAFACALIVLYVGILLWAWKAPLHVCARALAGAGAAGSILALSLVAISLALLIFSAYILVLFSLTLMSMIVFLPLHVWQELWLWYRRVTYRCPYDDCSYSGLPIHVCKCGQLYSDLRPSFYGMFHHRCRHGNETVKLPTLNILGRNRLPRLCGRCKRPLIHSSIGELREWPIAVVGAPSGGKTAFLCQATRELCRALPQRPGDKVCIDSQEQAGQLEYELAILDRGAQPAKTAGTEIQAFGLAVRLVKPRRLRGLLYLFDAPGETFETMHRFAQKQHLRHLSGLVLVADPFSLPVLAKRAEVQIGVNPAQTPFDQVVGVLIHGVDLLARREGGKCPLPLAVVLSKSDALPTEEFEFLSALGPTDGQPSSSVCRDAIINLGGSNSIRALEQEFSEVRYFACSALGRLPDHRNTAPFQPTGVIDPLLWLLERIGGGRGRVPPS